MLNDTLPIESSITSNCELDDFAQELFDITPPYDTAIMSEDRYNKDTLVNDNGKLLIDFCKVSNMKILNGRLGSDKGVGDFTYRHPQGNSTIDYCVVTPNLVPHIKNFDVDVFDPLLSDCHSPIILTLRSNRTVTYENENVTPESDIEYHPIFTKWCNENKLDFQLILP